MADVVDSIVHSFALAEMPHAPDLRHVMDETIRIPCLVNTVALEVGMEIVLDQPRIDSGAPSALADTRAQRGRSGKARHRRLTSGNRIHALIADWSLHLRGA